MQLITRSNHSIWPSTLLLVLALAIGGLISGCDEDDGVAAGDGGVNGTNPPMLDANPDTGLSDADGKSDGPGSGSEAAPDSNENPEQEEKAADADREIDPDNLPDDDGALIDLMHDELVKVADALETVKDEKSARAAADVIHAYVERVKPIAEQFKEKGGNAFQKSAAFQQRVGEWAETQQRLAKEMLRINFDSKLRTHLAEAFKELDL